jgi:hypothetical protein
MKISFMRSLCGIETTSYIKLFHYMKYMDYELSYKETISYIKL